MCKGMVQIPSKFEDDDTILHRPIHSNICSPGGNLSLPTLFGETIHTIIWAGYDVLHEWSTWGSASSLSSSPSEPCTVRGLRNWRFVQLANVCQIELEMRRPIRNVLNSFMHNCKTISKLSYFIEGVKRFRMSSFRWQVTWTAGLAPPLSSCKRSWCCQSFPSAPSFSSCAERYSKPCCERRGHRATGNQANHSEWNHANGN